MAVIKALRDLQEQHPGVPPYNVTYLCMEQIRAEYAAAKKAAPPHGELVRLAGERAQPLRVAQAAADAQEQRMQRGVQLSQKKIFGLSPEVFRAYPDMPRRQRLARKDLLIIASTNDGLEDPLDLSNAEGRNDVEKVLDALSSKIKDFSKLDRELQIAIASEILAAGGAKKEEEDPDEPEEDLEDEEPFKSPSGLSSRGMNSRRLTSRSVPNGDGVVTCRTDLLSYAPARNVSSDIARAITYLSLSNKSLLALDWAAQIEAGSAFVKSLPR